MLLLDHFYGLKLLAFHIWVLFRQKPLNMGRVDHMDVVLHRANGAVVSAGDSKSCSFGNEGSIPSFGTRFTRTSYQAVLYPEGHFALTGILTERPPLGEDVRV